ncbi:glycosyl hydrolase family 18 protein [Pseudonocardia oroxyli]|uniref:Spore germination protein YaaH n=1 Tax=Pseudonocardia oroxyli TaxID=366584 RepID=A0A1G7Z8D3_PSEOR|nr:glycosyl hydrolase family 18 protein [Pseudonocardia oroxyli]SDH04968.1 Spore germination protein YaaH [Pseudonocardia oroxyli]
MIGLALVLVTPAAIWVPRILAGSSEVVAAVPYWDLDDGLSSLARNRTAIDLVTPWWYGLAPDGTVVSDLPGGAAEEERALQVAREGGTRLLPTVASTHGGSWAPQVVRDVLHDDARLRAHVEALVALAASRDFAGLQLDYEDLDAGDRGVFTEFVAQLAGALHAQNRQLYVTVHPKTDDAGYDGRNLAQDYAAIGRSADRIVLMAYDWHWQDSTPGPIAPDDWVEPVIRYAVTQVPPDKLMLGVGLYGYDWPATGRGAPVVWREAMALAAAAGTTPQRDAGGAMHFAYTAADGVTHEVWFEDAESVEPKFALARQYGLAGVELWRLGGEDPAVWPLLGAG